MTMPQPTDPTRVRDQPQLTTATGTLWVIIGGVTCLLLGAMFLALWWQLGDELALYGALAMGIFFFGMLVLRVVIPAGRTRLLILAVDYLSTLLVAIVFVFLVLGAQ